jgi:GNAT superfamily N-acetyltransferase
MSEFEIKPATVEDVPLILTFIKGLAEYEKLAHEVVATEEILQETLFGPKPFAEVAIGYHQNHAVCFALFFHNFSTFLGRPGIYLEDLFVMPEFRGRGFGRKMLSYLAKLTRQRNGGRLEWSVLDWNESAIGFYKSLAARPLDEWTMFRVTGDALDRLAEES